MPSIERGGVLGVKTWKCTKQLLKKGRGGLELNNETHEET
jgi:hypothetical protein